MRLLVSPDKGNGPLAMDMLDVGHCFGAGLCNCLQQRIMLSVVAAQGCWATNEDVLKGTGDMLESYSHTRCGDLLCYTAWTMNLIHWGSDNLIVSNTPSHLVHAPCCCKPTIQLACSSSTLARNSPRAPGLPFPYHSKVVGWLPNPDCPLATILTKGLCLMPL